MQVPVVFWVWSSDLRMSAASIGAGKDIFQPLKTHSVFCQVDQILFHLATDWVCRKLNRGRVWDVLLIEFIRLSPIGGFLQQPLGLFLHNSHSIGDVLINQETMDSGVLFFKQTWASQEIIIWYLLNQIPGDIPNKPSIIIWPTTNLPMYTLWSLSLLMVVLFLLAVHLFDATPILLAEPILKLIMFCNIFI